MRLPSSLTEPISMGTFFEISGAASENDRMVMMRPSTLGLQPGRGGPNGPAGLAPRGNILAETALPALFSLDHSIFCSASMS